MTPVVHTAAPAARPGAAGSRDFKDAIAACNLLPGPASTQLAIFCAWRVRARTGALVGGACFILPRTDPDPRARRTLPRRSPPRWIRGAGAGAGAAVAAVALRAGSALLPDSWRRAKGKVRWLTYLAAGATAAATVGPWLVLVLLGRGRRLPGRHRGRDRPGLPRAGLLRRRTVRGPRPHDRAR
jgi:chromate transporter